MSLSSDLWTGQVILQLPSHRQQRIKRKTEGEGLTLVLAYSLSHPFASVSLKDAVSVSVAFSNAIQLSGFTASHELVYTSASTSAVFSATVNTFLVPSTLTFHKPSLLNCRLRAAEGMMDAVWITTRGLTALKIADREAEDVMSDLWKCS